MRVQVSGVQCCEGASLWGVVCEGVADLWGAGTGLWGAVCEGAGQWGAVREGAAGLWGAVCEYVRVQVSECAGAWLAGVRPCGSEGVRVRRCASSRV